MRTRVKAVLLALLAPLGVAAQPSGARERDIDPLSKVVDHPLDIGEKAVQTLKALRAERKFTSLPGVDTHAEREHLSRVADELLDRLILGVRSNPTKLWVMRQFQPSLALVEFEDTEAREHFGEVLWRIMQGLGIESSDGLLSAYL